MSLIKKMIYSTLLLATILCLTPALSAEPTINIPILCYHNFNPTVPGSMTLTPERFSAQVKWLKDNGFSIIPLQDAVDYLQGKRDSLPPKPIVITADDGWHSVYTYMLPVVRKYQFPVTLFIYPGTISGGKNVLSWNELKELQDTGLFDVQGHTYTHPNFKIEKRTLSPDKYAKFVQMELMKSKRILEEKLNKKITLLAWPFGIYNSYLEQAAADAGYIMAFSIDARPANRSFRPMAQPRFMIIEAQSTKTFESIANRAK